MAKREIERVNINLPSDLVERVMEYADKMAINKTSAIAILLSQSLDSHKAIDGIQELSKLISDLQNMSNVIESKEEIVE